MSDLRNQLEDYGSGDREVTGADGHYATVRWDAALPAIGEAVALRDDDSDEAVHGVVREHLGASQFRALLVRRPSWLAAGTSVEPTGSTAAFDIQTDDRRDGLRRIETDDVELVPDTDGDETIAFEPARPDFETIAPAPAALQLEWEPVDLLSPAVRGGVTLVLDRSGADSPFETIVERVLQQAEADTALRVGSGRVDDSARSDRGVPGSTGVGGSETGVGDMLALRAALALASEERDQGRDVLLVASLPRPARTTESDDRTATTPGLGELVDLIGESAVSTDTASVTTLLHFDAGRADPGVTTILESLGLGDADAQIAIDDEGRYAPENSFSDAELPDEQASQARETRRQLRRARDAEEQRQIFGDIELDEADFEALEAADALRVHFD